MQLSTLRAVSEALGAPVRDLVCGMAETDSRLNSRMALVCMILGSGDPVVIRLMDQGIESARILLERTNGGFQKIPSLVRMGRRTPRQAPTETGEPLDRQSFMPSSDLRAVSVPMGRRKAGKKLEKYMEVASLAGWNLKDAPGLPVGSASTDALPDTSRPREHHGKPKQPAQRSDRQSAKP
jgi:hypothetical protein